MASTDRGLKLLGMWASPFSMRVSLALELKGIAYENLPQDLGNKSQLLLDSNPVYKKIPVLLHDGKAICESLVILQYIDETWSGEAPLLPKDPYLRAEHRFWADFVDKKILDSMMRFVKGDESAAAAANKELIENYVLLDGALAKIGGDEGPFFGGASLSYLDVAFAPYTVWITAVAEVVGLKVASDDECPRLHRFSSAIAEHPTAKAVFPPLEKLKEYIQGWVPVWRGQKAGGK